MKRIFLERQINNASWDSADFDPKDTRTHYVYQVSKVENTAEFTVGQTLTINDVEALEKRNDTQVDDKKVVRFTISYPK